MVWGKTWGNTCGDEGTFYSPFVAQSRPPDTLRTQLLHNFIIFDHSHRTWGWTTTNLASGLHRRPTHRSVHGAVLKTPRKHGAVARTAPKPYDSQDPWGSMARAGPAQSRMGPGAVITLRRARITSHALLATTQAVENNQLFD